MPESRARTPHRRHPDLIRVETKLDGSGSSAGPFSVRRDVSHQCEPGAERQLHQRSRAHFMPQIQIAAPCGAEAIERGLPYDGIAGRSARGSPARSAHLSRADATGQGMNCADRRGGQQLGVRSPRSDSRVHNRSAGWNKGILAVLANVPANLAGRSHNRPSSMRMKG